MAFREGSACPNTEVASMRGALRVWVRGRVAHGGGARRWRRTGRPTRSAARVRRSRRLSSVGPIGSQPGATPILTRVAGFCGCPRFEFPFSGDGRGLMPPAARSLARGRNRPIPRTNCSCSTFNRTLLGGSGKQRRLRSAWRARYSAEMPPVMLMACPLILAAAEEARKTASPASFSLLTTPSEAIFSALAKSRPANGSAITLA